MPATIVTDANILSEKSQLDVEQLQSQLNNLHGEVSAVGTKAIAQYYTETKFIHAGGKVTHVGRFTELEELSEEERKDLLQNIIKYAQRTGAYKILLPTKMPELFEKHGFYSKENYMELELPCETKEPKHNTRLLRYEDLGETYYDTLEQLSKVRPINNPKALFDEVTKQAISIFVIEEDGVIVSTAGLYIHQDVLTGEKIGHVEDIATSGAHRGQGLGSSLMRRISLEAQKQGCAKIVLECADHLIEFNSKFGFRVTGTSMRYDLK